MMNDIEMKKYLGPLSKDNPILVQTLGVCSALAVTAQLKPAVVMALSVTVVCACSNFIISLMRNTIPPRIRFIVQFGIALFQCQCQILGTKIVLVALVVPDLRDCEVGILDVVMVL